MQVQGKYDARVFLTAQMTRTQGQRLKRLSEEAYQPTQYDRDLSSAEAARRIRALEAEIERARASIARKQSQKSAADALFSFGGSPQAGS